MRIIRDKNGEILPMIPLLLDWNIRRCNVLGRKKKPNTIIRDIAPGVGIMGLCEEHFQQGNVPGGCRLSFEWDDYDAFASKEE